MIKIAASKSFILCGVLIILAMIVSTFWATVVEGLEGKDILAAPLLVLFTGIYCFIFVYPAVFLSFVLYAKFKN